MSDDHRALGRTSGATCAQAVGDIFVRQAVEAVAAHALGVEPLRNGVMIRDRAVAAMKRGIEAGDLRQIGKALEQRADRREIVRLVQRRQRNVALEIVRARRASIRTGSVVLRSAMHDAMADRGGLELLLSHAAMHPRRERRRERRRLAPAR